MVSIAVSIRSGFLQVGEGGIPAKRACRLEKVRQDV